jgi:hypothetical protein
MGNGAYLLKLTGVESESCSQFTSNGGGCGDKKVAEWEERAMIYGILLTDRRAGCPPDSQQMKDLLTALSKSDAVETFGFYSRMSLIVSPACSLPRIFLVCHTRTGNMPDRLVADVQTSDNLTLPKH